MEIIFVAIGGIITFGIVKTFLVLAAVEDNKTHSPYLREEEQHRRMEMLKSREDPRYFP